MEQKLKMRIKKRGRVVQTPFHVFRLEFVVCSKLLDFVLDFLVAFESFLSQSIIVKKKLNRRYQRLKLNGNRQLLFTKKELIRAYCFFF